MASADRPETPHYAAGLIPAGDAGFTFHPTAARSAAAAFSPWFAAGESGRVRFPACAQPVSNGYQRGFDTVSVQPRIPEGANLGKSLCEAEKRPCKQ
jgi:hypothetical protein